MKTDLELLVTQLDYTSDDFDQKYSLVLNLLNTELDHRQLKNELVTYATKVQQDLGVLDYPSNLVGLEGKIAYCLNRGAKLPAKSHQRVSTFLQKIADNFENSVHNWTLLPTTAQGKNIQQYVNCYSHIDNVRAQYLHGKVGKREIGRKTREIIHKYSPENKQVHKLLLEHYLALVQESRKDTLVAHWVPALDSVVEALNLLVNATKNAKQAQKNRKERILSSSLLTRDKKGQQAAEKVKIKELDTELGLSSIDPTTLVGAEAAVIYNTKTRHVEIYRSSGDARLSMKGARITNFDPTLSQGRVLRKPESWLPRWTSATTLRRLEVLIADIKGKSWQLTGKLNSNHLIIKVL